MKILTTGATGHFGSKVVELLLKRVPSERIAVSVRDPRKTSALRERGVDVRRGDFDDSASLARAFAGVDRLLIVSTDGDNETRLRQHRNAVKAAENAGVGFVAYTSLIRADTSPLALAEVHRQTEAAIRATGIPYCFLRNNWYLENEAGAVQSAANGGPVVTAAGQGRVGWVARADLAEAAAVVLAGDGHENTVYELSGTPHTYEELARIIGRVLGREVPVRHVDDVEYEKMLGGFGLPGYLVELLVDAQRAMRKGALDVTSGDLEKLLGRPATSLEEGVRRILDSIAAGA